MTLPVGIYVRVSRKGDRDDERFHSPREQKERAEALARAKGFTTEGVFEDIDVSGATRPEERPAMLRLLEAIDRGELAGIAAFSLDRLSREPSHGDALVKRVTKAGGVILTPDIPDAIDSPTGEFTFGMLLQVAKLYRSQAGVRFASAKERSILAGIPVGPTPVGYRLRPDRRLELDPKMAPVVREVFERWANGEGRTKLSDILHAATGRPWSRQAVPALIKRRLYATGRLEYGELVSEWDAGAIVDEALWHAAQRAPAPRRAPRSEETRWLLTGLLECEACGLKLAPHSTGPGLKYRSYRCVSRRCTNRAHVNAERIERWVVQQAFGAGDEIVTRSEAADLGTLEDAVALAERRLAQVLEPDARDALGDLWAADVKARRLERDNALAELGTARQEARIPSSEFRLREVWAGLSQVDRRAALSLFWRAIRVARKNGKGTPVTLVSRGPHAEAEILLPQ